MALSGGLLFFIRKSSSLSALMQNFKIDSKEASLDDQIAKNNGLLSAEEKERERIKNEKPNGTDDVVSYFNSDK